MWVRSALANASAWPGRASSHCLACLIDSFVPAISAKSVAKVAASSVGGAAGGGAGGAAPRLMWKPDADISFGCSSRLGGIGPQTAGSNATFVPLQGLWQRLRCAQARYSLDCVRRETRTVASKTGFMAKKVVYHANQHVCGGQRHRNAAF